MNACPSFLPTETSHQSFQNCCSSQFRQGSQGFKSAEAEIRSTRTKKPPRVPQLGNWFDTSVYPLSFAFPIWSFQADLLGGVSSKFKTHLAKLSHPWREEVREELSSEEAAVIYRYFWWAQQPLGAKEDPRGIQGGSKHLPTRD